MMTKVDYQKWLSQKTWEVTQAIPLLFGVNPEFVNKHIGKNGRTQYYVSNIIERDSSTYHQVNLDHINEMFAEYDFELGLKECEIIDHTDFDISTPSDWLDWFSGYGVKPNSELVDAAKLVGWQPVVDETSIVVRYYKYWAKKEAWSFHDAIALLSRTKPQQFDSLPVILPDCAYSGDRRLSQSQSEELIYSIASQAIPFVEVDLHSHIERRFAPTDIIEWAKSKGYSYPTLLMQIMGFEAPINQSTGNAKAEEEFKLWFIELVRSKPKPEQTKPKYQKDAQDKFSGLSARGFLRVWNEVTAGTAYAGKGRRSKK